MPLLVRKITRSKWPAANFDKIEIDDLSSDAITSCLRTSSNTLSTWEIDSLAKIEEAVLALASNFQKLETIFVVTIDKGKILENGFVIKNTPGNFTPIKDLNHTHTDIAELTYKKLGVFSYMVLTALEMENVHVYSVKDLKEMILKAIADDRLDKNSLHANLLSKLGA